MQVPNLIREFVEPLETLKLSYFVTGSTAGIMYGEPRMTHDVDIVLELTRAVVPAFAAAFPLTEFYCPPSEILMVEIARGQRGHFNLISHKTGFKADIYLAYDELHRWAMAARKRVALGDLELWVAPPEYVIIRKLQYYVEGESTKHLRDIASVIEVSREQLDFGLIETWVVRLRIEHAWNKARP